MDGSAAPAPSTTARKKRPCRPICGRARSARRASAIAGRSASRADGELASRHPRGLLALRLLRLRGRARARRARRHRARRARHPRPRAGRARRGARRQGPAGARRGLHGAEHRWVEAAGRSVRRHRSRQRPPSGEDVRDRRRRRTRPRRSSISILGSLQFSEACSARLRPSRAARRRGGDQRRGLHAVQRGGVHQAAGPRRLGRLAPGRLDALGQPDWTRAPTASTSWASSTAAPRPTACGWCPARTAGKADIKAMVGGGRQRAAARRRADHLRSRATSRSPTARRSTAPSPTPARTGA